MKGDLSCREVLFLFETVARRRSAALLSGFGLGHVREYAPSALTLSALHLILRSKSQHILIKCARMVLRATFSFCIYTLFLEPQK